MAIRAVLFNGLIGAAECILLLVHGSLDVSTSEHTHLLRERGRESGVWGGREGENHIVRSANKAHEEEFAVRFWTSWRAGCQAASHLLSGAVMNSLMVGAGGFEAGFDSGQGSLGFGMGNSSGQTREHAQLARSLGIEQLAVVISKLDTCNYSQVPPAAQSLTFAVSPNYPCAAL